MAHKHAVTRRTHAPACRAIMQPTLAARTLGSRREDAGGLRGAIGCEERSGGRGRGRRSGGRRRHGARQLPAGSSPRPARDARRRHTHRHRPAGPDPGLRPAALLTTNGTARI